MESVDSPSSSLKRKPAPVDSEFLQESKGKFEESQEFFTPMEGSEASPRTQCTDKDEKKDQVSEVSTDKYSDDRKTEEIVSQEKNECEAGVGDKVQGEGVKESNDEESKEKEVCLVGKEEKVEEVQEGEKDEKPCEDKQVADQEVHKEHQLKEDPSDKGDKDNAVDGL